MIWYRHQWDNSGFMREWRKFLKDHQKSEGMVEFVSPSLLFENSVCDANIKIKKFSHCQKYNLMQFVNYVCSFCSLNLDDKDRFDMLKEKINSLFHRFADNGEVQIDLMTEFYCGKLLM
ncbi:MAG: hypothetical protein LBT79_01565 [Elusimicrobiota bacterium]|nr:hypothetical protein [Elusimicrobiota bacterium]